MKKMRQDKNEIQKIRLILNVITPDNFDKKFKELRGFLFNELKTKTECEEEGIGYNEEEHKLSENWENQEILDTIV